MLYTHQKRCRLCSVSKFEELQEKSCRSIAANEDVTLAVCATAGVLLWISSNLVLWPKHPLVLVLYDLVLFLLKESSSRLLRALHDMNQSMLLLDIFSRKLPLLVMLNLSLSLIHCKLLVKLSYQ